MKYEMLLCVSNRSSRAIKLGVRRVALALLALLKFLNNYIT